MARLQFASDKTYIVFGEYTYHSLFR